MPGAPPGPRTYVRRFTSRKRPASAPGKPRGRDSAISNGISVTQAAPSKRSSSSAGGTSGRSAPGGIGQWRNKSSRQRWNPTARSMAVIAKYVTGEPSGPGDGIACRQAPARCGSLRHSPKTWNWGASAAPDPDTLRNRSIGGDAGHGPLLPLPRRTDARRALHGVGDHLCPHADDPGRSHPHDARRRLQPGRLPTACRPSSASTAPSSCST